MTKWIYLYIFFNLPHMEPEYLKDPPTDNISFYLIFHASLYSTIRIKPGSKN